MAERRHIGPVCAAAQGLYAELCRQYNKFPDPAGFECDNGFLMEAMGNCSINSLKKYREQLVTAGLIDYLSRQEEKKAGIYRMLDLGKPAGACSNSEHAKERTSSEFEHEGEPACSNSEHDKGATSSNIEHGTPLTTSNFEHEEEKAETPACSKFEVEHVQNLNTTLNKSKVVDTYVSTLSLKKEGEEKVSELEESVAGPVFQMPAIPVAADPFETSAPEETKSPLIATVPPKAKKAKATQPVFQKPTPEQLEDYFADRRPEWPSAKCKEEAQSFYDHYKSNGWKIGGKSSMVDWQAAVRNWLRRNFSNAHTPNNSISKPAGRPAAGANSKTGAAGTARSRSGTIASIQSRKHGTDSDPVQRAEFTDAEIVD